MNKEHAGLVHCLSMQTGREISDKPFGLSLSIPQIVGASLP